MAKDIKINKNQIVNIDGRVLTYENMIIQMSNISRVSIDTAPKIKYPTWALLGLLLSIVAVFYIPVMGIIGVIICGYKLYSVYTQNSNPIKYLVLALNNGDFELFQSKNRDFLSKAYQAMLESLKGEKNMTINFDGCIINGNQAFNGDVVMGDNIKNNNQNEIYNTKSGESSTVEVTKEKIGYWEELEKMFTEIMEECKGYPDEYLFCEKALKYSRQKNTKGLSELIATHKTIIKTILTDIISNVAADGLLGVLRNLHIIK